MSIDCAEARRMIDAGLRPGAADVRRASLGFHLAGCQDCRAYRDRGDLELLGALLGEGDEPPSPLPPSPRPWGLRRQPLLRYALMGALAVIVGGLGFVFGQVAYAAYTISQNVAAMRVSEAPAGPSPTPLLQVPTSNVAVAPAQAPVPLALPTAAPSAAVVFEPPPPGAERPPTATAGAQQPGPPAGFVPSPTPIALPSIVGGAERLPTLMPTAPIVPVSGRAVNVLLLGSDRRPGESWATRSDAVVVIRLDPGRQRAAMLSLPRDLIVPIPGYGQARINAATVYGELYPDLGGGLGLARRTVSDYLDIPIDYVLRTDFQAFTEAVDAIGGVDIDVPEALYDPAYPTMDYGYMVASFDAGLQHMDGERALIYARIRHSDSSYARERRQQQVLLAILNQVRERNILAQVQMISDLTTALRDDIQTDMSLEQMLGLAWAFRGVSPDMVERYSLDETMVSEGVLADDPYAIFADPGSVRGVVRQFVGGGAQ